MIGTEGKAEQLNLQPSNQMQGDQEPAAMATMLEGLQQMDRELKQACIMADEAAINLQETKEIAAKEFEEATGIYEEAIKRAKQQCEEAKLKTAEKLKQAAKLAEEKDKDLVVIKERMNTILKTALPVYSEQSNSPATKQQQANKPTAAQIVSKTACGKADKEEAEENPAKATTKWIKEVERAVRPIKKQLAPMKLHKVTNHTCYCEQPEERKQLRSMGTHQYGQNMMA
ncbi:hypothetical protein IWW36_003416 [Coemansia brasiliensis]|uniref:Uncharacterized protein n=1 Tax=Coemansia brasiliensis TaxID=2650707 RepID=A0A9W8LX88_9FUNG|nr:hypothetical protein IWW36_003416 [Coemansia brasiliensis]